MGGAMSPSDRMPVASWYKQRLEQVMVGPVDEGDIDIRSPQGLGGEQPAEAAAHDCDAMPPAGLCGAHQGAVESRHSHAAACSCFCQAKRVMPAV